MNYCVLNGKKSTLIKGLLIQSLPPISKPLMRTSVEEIDGRDGDIVTRLGYSAYDKQMTIGLFGDYDIDEVIRYFDSEGIVIFSNEPDKYYKYQILAQIDYAKLLRFKTAIVTFHCQPFKYSAVDDDILFTSELIKMKPYTTSIAGITATVEKGVITVQGTAINKADLFIPAMSTIAESGQYTQTISAVGDVGGLVYVGEIPIGRQITEGETSISFETEQDYHIESVHIAIPEGESVDFELETQLYYNDLDSVSVFNRGNIYSRPALTIYGTDDITLHINGIPRFNIYLANEGYITLDGADMNAYKGNRLMNRYVEGNYNDLRLDPGTNEISWIGTVNKIQFKDVSRWI